MRDPVYGDAKVSRPGWHRHHQSFGLGLGQGLGLKGLVSYSITASILCPRQKCSFLAEIRTPHLLHGSLGPVSQMRRDCGFIVSRPLDLNQLSSSWSPDAGGTGTPQHWTSALAVDDQLPPVDVS